IDKKNKSAIIIEYHKEKKKCVFVLHYFLQEIYF
ncbi:MAG: hypothetical protein UR83_C0013G0001, partial [Candidatus Moranbacteria bacterium GW2011_GWF2_35_54]